MADEIQLNADTSGAVNAFKQFREAVDATGRSLNLNDKQMQKSGQAAERLMATMVANSMKNASVAQQAAAAGRQNAGALDAQAQAARRLADEEKRAYAAMGLRRNSSGRVINADTGTWATKAQIDAANASKRSLEQIVALEEKRGALERMRAINAQNAHVQEQKSLQIAREQTAEYQKRQAQLNRAFASGIVGLANPDATRWERLRNVLNQIPPATWGHAFSRASDALLGMSNSARYALYSVSAGATVAGAAVAGFGALSIKAAIDHERAFANVERTTQTSVEGYEALRRQLEKMSMELPISFEELTNIATAAGQLGIQASGIENFTRTVAMLTATTNLTSDAAGNALARFKAFFAEADDPSLAVTERTFGNLASSILKVGVNSIATESGIVNVATQISSMGDYAGFTADQVIGLSGALSSVGVAPELSRGITTRLFTIMGDAVSQSGVQLEKFAQLSGVSASEFKSAWGTDQFANIFTGFLQGLNKVDEAGGDANQTLRELGITAVRDRPVWLRLANAAGETGEAGSLLAQTMEDARQGWVANIELALQYQKISRTTAARLQVMTQAFEQLFAAMGEESASFVGELAEGITGVVRGFEEFAQSPAGKVLGTIAAQGALVVGSFLLVVGALAAMAATAQGVGTAFTQMTAAGVAGATRLTAAFRVMTLSAGFVGIAVTLATVIGTFLAMEGAARKASMPVQDMGGLLAAMRDDAENGAVGLTYYASAAGGAADDSKAAAKQADGMAQALYGVKDGGHTAADGLDTAAGAAERVKYVFGEAATAFAKSQLLLDEGFQKLFDPRKETGLIADRLGVDLSLFDWDAIIKTSAAEGGDVQARVLREIEKQTKGRDLGNLVGAPNVLAGQVAGVFTNMSGEIQGAIDSQRALATNTKHTVNQMVDDFELLDDVTQQTVGKMATAFAKFVDPSALIGLTQKFTDKSAEGAEAFEKAWVDAYGGTKFSIEDYMAVFRRAAGEQSSFIEGLQTLGSRGLSAGIIEELAQMGPQASQLVQALLTSTDAQLAEYEELWGQTGFDSMVRFATQAAIGQQIVNNVMATGGIEALRAFNEKLASGVGVDEALAQLQRDVNGNPVKPKVDPPGAIPNIPWSEREAWIARNRLNLPVTPYLTASNISVMKTGEGSTSAHFAARIARAEGGPVYGAGTGTSDSIPAWLSNGEFVMTAKATRAIGVQNLYALMRSAQGGRAAPRGRGYATGGVVGGPSGSVGVSYTSLSPEDRRLLRDIASAMQISIGTDAVAGATQNAEYWSSRRGR